MRPTQEKPLPFFCSRLCPAKKRQGLFPPMLHGIYLQACSKRKYVMRLACPHPTQGLLLAFGQNQLHKATHCPKSKIAQTQRARITYCVFASLQTFINYQGTFNKKQALSNDK
jgi:hypothetical protein